MHKKLQVTFVEQSDRYCPHERIIHIGGFSEDILWKHTQAEVMENIEKKKHSYFMVVDNHHADVLVSAFSGHKYIKTTDDSSYKAYLLTLPNFV